MTRYHLYKKKERERKKKENFKKLASSQVWWHMPVVPAMQEAEVGGSLESGRLRLQ